VLATVVLLTSENLYADSTVEYIKRLPHLKHSPLNLHHSSVFV